MSDKLELTPTELDSGLWKKIVAHYEARLAMLRRKNDNDLDAVKTADLRGRIAEVKRMLGRDPANKGNDREAGS